MAYARAEGFRVSGMVLGRVKKFLIEDDYYLIPEERDWAIARFRGGIRKDGSDDIDYLTFHQTIEQALQWYFADKARRMAGKCGGTTIQQLLEHLTVEQAKTRKTLETLLHNVEVLK